MNEQRKPAAPQTDHDKKPQNTPPLTKEIGGRKGPEPTRYGDWENNGIASDF